MKFFYIIFILISFQLNAQWTSLIGDDLSNWRTVQGKAIFELNDGIISSASVLNSPNTFLITKDIYSDFILEFEVFVEEGLKKTISQFHFHMFLDINVKLIQMNLEDGQEEYMMSQEVICFYIPLLTVEIVDIHLTIINGTNLELKL